MADLPTSRTPVTAEQMALALGTNMSDAQSGAAWFGPGAALAPIAPPEVAGRRFDLPFAFNKQILPKMGDRATITPQQLRDLSESWDILRAVIESRKDRGSVVPLKFRDRDHKSGKKESSGVVTARQFFRKPDGLNTLTTWRRMIREDMYVLDAPTVYQSGKRGAVKAFEVIDGATIKILSDNYGRPMAYQQVLKGVQAVNYSREQIIYSPRNVRPHKFYGFSPVEQSVITIETGLRRALGQLKHFTDGNIPEMFITCPETWQPSQVKEMQDYFDAIMSGNLGKRSGAIFIPGGVKPESIKGDALLKNEFDEWVARVICYFFSVSPQPFIREMNRATAETAQGTAMSEGVLSELSWEKELFDEMLDRMGMPEIEVVHDTTQEPDPKTQNEIVAAQVASGLISKTAARRVLGIAEEDAPEDVPPPVLAAPVVPAAVPAPKEEAKPAIPAAKCDHSHEIAVKSDDDLPAMDSEQDMIDIIRAAQADMLVKATEQAQAAFAGEKIPEALMSKAGRKLFVKALQAELVDQAATGITDAAKQVTATADAALLESPAKAWASDRAAWMVGMKWEDGIFGKKLIENPDADYRITDEVRLAVRSSVADAFENRLTASELSQNLSQAQAFSPRHALMIARTEIAEAQESGSMIYYKAAGVKRKRWSGAANCCPLCQANEDAGPIGINTAFPSGHQHGPAHPNDRCRVLPVEGDA